MRTVRAIYSVQGGILPFSERFNFELMAKVVEHIKAEPKRFNMFTWLSRGKPGEIYSLCLDALSRETGQPLHRWNRLVKSTQEFPACGTIGCIAGWTVNLDDPVAAENLNTVSVPRAAREALGLTEWESNRLFIPSDWPKKFLLAYRKGGQVRKTQVAAARIKHFIETEGRE